ncbi:Phosphoenolpyruvate-protein phosphotransferase of PTS system [Chitinispirillum alkaliphilum]|nr:Phosphoenolpyruvate-protein phosphotransferase of PTS system [Chitinispirillum alkaliphilum]
MKKEKEEFAKKPFSDSHSSEKSNYSHLCSKIENSVSEHSENLSQQDVRSATDSEALDIQNHQKQLSAFLGRPVSLKTAAVDYFESQIENVNSSIRYSPFIKNSPISDATEPIPEVSSSICKKRVIFRGIPLVDGIGIGRVYYYRDILSGELEKRSLSEKDIPHELRRLENAIRSVKEEIERLSNIVKTEVDSRHAAIFDVFTLILNDCSLINRLRNELINQRINGEQVVSRVFSELVQEFFSSDNDILAEKRFDLTDIRNRILKKMIGMEDNVLSTLPPGAVVVTKRLLPSDTIHFTHCRPHAIVTEEGGINSHSALLARAMQIPSISQISLVGSGVVQNSDVIVDGETGTVIINPTESELSHFSDLFKARESRKSETVRKAQKTPTKFRNETVGVFANVSTQREISDALSFGSEGIGLFRIEPLYMHAKELPSEEQLYSTLTNHLKPVKNQTVTLRLADFGGDKTLPYMPRDQEYCSLLGLRGIRFLFRHQQILRSQIRACIRLSKQFNIRLLVPMVTVADDMKWVRYIINEEKQKLGYGNYSLPLGAMIETPAAVLDINRILRESDFVNIGTNDLVQYLAAADRESYAVSNYYSQGLSLSLPLIARVIRKCSQRSVDCVLCGESAGDSRLLLKLLRFGLRNFSVPPPLTPLIRMRIQQLE